MINGLVERQQDEQQKASVSKGTAGSSAPAPASTGQATDGAPTEGERIEAIIASLEGRRDFYRLLEALYYKTVDQDDIERMANAGLDSGSWGNRLMDDGFHDIDRYLRKRDTGTRQNLAVDFTSAFMGTKTYKGRAAEPYESLFIGEEKRLASDRAGQVYNEFKHERVRLQQGVDLPSDHLSFEMEFMAILSERAIALVENRDFAGALSNVRKQKAFLEDHMMSWFGLFQDQALKIVRTRFYRGVMKVTAGFFELDDETLNDMIDELSDLKPFFPMAAKKATLDEC